MQCRTITFQSLFWWKCSERGTGGDKHSYTVEFQSLFWWKCSESKILRVRGAWERCFNPCFDGSVARALAGTAMPPETEGFNPCFDGSVARAGSTSRITTAMILFQSLFWWKCSERLRSMTSSAANITCFNPCFDGSVARAIFRRFIPPSGSCFNPCFDGSVARGVD